MATASVVILQMTIVEKPAAVGVRLGMAVILKGSVPIDERPVRGKRFVVMLCDCGTEYFLRKDLVTKGISSSCGCVRHVYRSHGMTKTPTYRSWKGMDTRCNNSNNRAYPRWGGRGITICERWSKFENFLADMGKRPDGTSLDRIDNNKGYSPENCRWASVTQQSRNRSITRMVTAFGVTRPMAEWAEMHSIAYDTLKARLNRLWTPEDALTVPVRKMVKERT